MCLVLTDGTRLACPEQLEEVEGVCRRWTCDGSVTQEQTHYSIGTSCTWRSREANGTCSALRTFLLEATLTLKLARPRRKSDRVGHQNRELPRLHPDDVAHRQPRADLHVPEEHLQNSDDLVALQCTARQERQRRGTITIGNPVHGAFEPNGYVNRSRDIWLLPFTTTLTFRALHGNHIVMVTLAIYSRLFLSTFTFSAMHGHLATIRESSWTFTHACLRLHHFDILSTVRTQTCSHFLQTFALPVKVVQLKRDTAQGTSHRIVRFVFLHQNPSFTNDSHDLPQWFHVFATS